MGFQESLDIACLSRKTHGFDKKDCIGRGEAGIPLEKKMETRAGRKEVRARSAGGNLCSARMEIYGPLIGGVGSAIGVKRWETEMETPSARSRGCVPRNF